MARNQITLNVLRPSSIDRVIGYLEAYKEDVAIKCDETVRELAEAGCELAQEGFFSDTVVDTNETLDGWEIEAVGDSCAFVEFGTGVHYNGDGSQYPLPRPDGIVGIGQYGMGHGMQDSWVYYDATNQRFRTTHGIQMRMPMAKASAFISENALKFARSVFK